MSDSTSDLLIVSGLSGSGKSIVLDMLEDLGYYCIDNLPLSMLGTLHPRALVKTDERYSKLAIGVDARTGGHIDELPVLLDTLRDAYPEFRIRTLFLQAELSVLLRRFSETRRRHPLTEGQLGLGDALKKEKELLDSISNIADFSLDTSNTNLHELREQVRNLLAIDSENQMVLQVQSFGFKHGLPLGLDLVFDVRCLPNPHWEKALRPMTGLNEGVQQWLQQFPVVHEMVSDIDRFLQTWLPRYQEQNRNYLTVGIGCTGGQHRSVYVAESLGKRLQENRRNVIIRHMEIR